MGGSRKRPKKRQSKRRRNKKVFRGQLMYTTKCFSGHIINEETNPFWTLPLSLKDRHDETYSVVEEQPFAEGGTYNSSAAYLLMYRASERLRDENEQRDTGRKMQKEKCDAKHKPVGPSFTEYTIQEDVVFVPQQTQNTKYSKQDLDPSETVDLVEKGRKKEEVTHRLPYGLYNQGATCYLNSVLQVLSVTTEIHDRLEPKTQTDQELKNIFQKLKETTCNTGNITKSLGIENVHQQRDAAECLELILNQISRPASEVFRGELMYTTKCSSSHIINEETNPFWTLPLSLKDRHDETYSVENGFAKFFQSKLFNGDNMVYCNDCNVKTEAESGCKMVEFPQILTLLLKRFEFDFNTMKHVKTNCIVGVPRALKRQKKRYELYGMVNHVGSLSGGHYTATVLSKEDNTWYEFDDTRVYEVDKQPSAKGGTYNSIAAYLLVYRASESLRDEDEQRDTGRKMQKEKCDAKHKPVGPRFTEDTIQEDVFDPQQRQNTKYSKQDLDPSKTVDLEKGCKKEDDENSQQLWKSSTCKKISLIVCGVVVGVVIALPIICK